MNTLEKRKLEGVITSRLQDARTAFIERRKREHALMVEKFNKTIPAKVKDIIKKHDDVKADFARQDKGFTERERALATERSEARTKLNKKVEALKEEAEKLGYELSTYGDEASAKLAHKIEWTGHYRNTAVYVYSEPTLTAHSKETAEQTQKLDDMVAEYAIAVWADNGDMGNLLDRFTKELHAIV